MSDRFKNVLFALLTAAMLSVSGISLNMWADWREWKAYKEAMKESRMTALEMQVKSDQEINAIRLQALNERTGDNSRRITDLEHVRR